MIAKINDRHRDRDPNCWVPYFYARIAALMVFAAFKLDNQHFQDGAKPASRFGMRLCKCAGEFRCSRAQLH